MPRRSEPVLPWRRLSSRLSRESSGLFLALAFFATLAPAQTLQQAEALWKARRYQDANTVFRDLVAREPRNAVIRVRWGRMFLEHWQADEAERLFDEALELKPNDAGALLGKALVGAEVYSGNAVEFAQQALLSDPKLVEAQELLARLALRRRQSQGRSRSRTGARARRQFRPGESHPRHDGLAGGQKGEPLGSARGQRLRDRRPFLHAQPAL